MIVLPTGESLHVGEVVALVHAVENAYAGMRHAPPDAAAARLKLMASLKANREGAQA